MSLTAPDRLILHPIEIPSGASLLEVAGSLKYSAVDGPGNRYVLFLQGCNFDCTACHNPSTIGRCDACGACVGACPHGALSFPAAGVVGWSEAACDRCRACLVPCPIDADPAIRVLTVDSILAEVREVASFITGITVTGGEPTIQLDGLVDLFAAMRADDELRHLTRLVDSNGTLARRGWRRLLPVMDGAMIDLKAGTPELHEAMTGHSDRPVKDSIRFLSDAEKLAEIRLLVIEGVTDTAAELEAWAGFVSSVDPATPVRIMAFRHQGTRAAAREWAETSPEGVARVRDRLGELGLTDVAG